MTLQSDAIVEVVAFRVDGHRFAVRLEQVVEVLRLVAVTPVPDAPDWLAGIVDLRGTLVPLVDLRPRFGAARVPADPSHVFLVTEARGRTAGVLADGVDDVVQVPGTAIARAHDVTGSDGAVEGLAHAPEGALVILDIERLLHGGEVANWAQWVEPEVDRTGLGS